jgi:benzoyl-CoA reductase subunit C
MAIGGVFYNQELHKIIDDVYKVNGVKMTTENLNHSIKLYNKNRRLIEEIYAIRQEFPWRLSAVDTYKIIRAGLSITVEEHNKILEDVVELIMVENGEPMDNIRVVINGSFCEQPPLGLIKSIEMAGCYIVDDDFMLGSRWIEGDVEEDTNDPLGALVNAYLTKSTFSSAVYDVGNPKGKRLVEQVKRRNADGVIFSAASFCDPALLDRPELQKECDAAGIPHINFQYHENTGQFKVIKEQAGTFSDSIKLWA